MPRRSHSFNPRTRVGCDLGRARAHHRGLVSIHAPVWGATYCLNCHELSLAVSIHAPVWGATTKQKSRCRCIASFNPRTRVGCDEQVSGAVAYDVVSIHAPVWGATCQGHRWQYWQGFQSTHPCGVRRCT